MGKEKKTEQPNYNTDRLKKYWEENKQEINKTRRDKYKNDAEYRERQLQRMRDLRARQKAERQAKGGAE